MIPEYRKKYTIKNEIRFPQANKWFGMPRSIIHPYDYIVPLGTIFVAGTTTSCSRNNYVHLKIFKKFNRPLSQRTDLSVPFGSGWIDIKTYNKYFADNLVEVTDEQLNQMAGCNS